jgi:ParB-like chromosome segregation protein Spo0J
MKYTQHPLSSAFPAMTAQEYQDLRDSVEVNGVLNPITIFEDMVLDGWHRYKAANESNMDCPEVELEDWIDPKDFVLAQNKNRRHITSAQLAMATTAVYAWASRGRQNKSALSADLNKTSAELAEISGTSERTINQAKTVLKNASPEVQEAVKSGKIGLSKAQAISKLPKDQQAAAINKALPKEAPEKPILTQYYGPEEEELKANELAAEADREWVNKLLESDDVLNDAHTEIKRLNLLVAQKDARIAALMTEKNEAIKDAKRAQSQLDKIRKTQK